jgi:hypothetical protein
VVYPDEAKNHPQHARQRHAQPGDFVSESGGGGGRGVYFLHS